MPAGIAVICCRVKKVRLLGYAMAVEIGRAPTSFSDWEGLLHLLHAAFAYQDDRIDPPSSVHKLDPESIAAKAAEDVLFVATEDGERLR